MLSDVVGTGGMPVTEDHTVFLTQVEDGSYLCVSVNAPRFALSAPTEMEAKLKARRALEFYFHSRQEDRPNAARETIVKSYSFEPELVCA